MFTYAVVVEIFSNGLVDIRYAPVMHEHAAMCAFPSFFSISRIFIRTRDYAKRMFYATYRFVRSSALLMPFSAALFACRTELLDFAQVCRVFIAENTWICLWKLNISLVCVRVWCRWGDESPRREFICTTKYSHNFYCWSVVFYSVFLSFYK